MGEFSRNTVSVDWLKENIDDPRLIILDASIKKVGVSSNTGSENLMGIPGARFFDLKNKFSDQQSNLPNTIPSAENFSLACQTLGINQNSIIVIYDKIGIYSSPRAWWLFKAMGHNEVAVLDGGLPEWIRAGGALAKQTLDVEIIPGNFIGHLRKDWVVGADQVLSNLTSEECPILDARSAGRFDGTEKEPRAGLRGGHIPKSKSLPFKSVLEDGKFKSPEALRLIFEALHIGKERVIYSCGSGITACILLLAANIAGYDNAAVFDGSWTEWALGDYPIN